MDFVLYHFNKTNLLLLLGFTRKQQKDVRNYASEEFREIISKADSRGEMMNKNRCELLRSVDSRYNYDLINGSERRHDVRVEVVPKIEGKRRNGDGLGVEAVRRGNAILRESDTGRFFTPQPSGAKQQYRQDIIVKEGLHLPKTSSVMRLPSYSFEEGRRKVGILPSYGIEEQFCKSEYAPKSKVKRSRIHFV